MNEIVYQHWFLNNTDISYGKKPKLLEYFYDSYHIFNASKTELMESGLLDEKVVDKFIENRNKAQIEKEYESFCHSPFSFITMENPSYPQKLRDIYDPAYGLFYNGKLPEFNHVVSIVGARRCSAYGKKIALELGEALGQAGIIVISGMARGIDSFAHRGCLDGGGNTVAVLGCGCDVIYPKENRLLYEEIVERGAVLSEYPIGTSPIALNFPRRNRIVSALSDVVVVVEARSKSGSLITTDFALEQGKDIYVIPGRIGDALSEGCNKLIAQGAGIITDIDKFVQDLTDLYGMENKREKAIKRHLPKLDEKQKKVYGLFDYYPKSIATVLEECELDYLELLAVIFSLEKLGLLYEPFKNNYVKPA
ncbi:MAG: DNA-processing protein DprA [Pseudobutyrivibrio sp.]|nr:DNA-processing protein DprA [Pseudobutyrivibrio sp.]